MPEIETAETIGRDFPVGELVLVHFHDDDSYSAYCGPIWLCHEFTKDAAEAEAKHIVKAFRNGAEWAVERFPGLPF